jgi:hypothetical protein
VLEQNPIIVAVLALLALPGVTSFIVSLIRKATDSSGVKPEVIVYVASLAVTGLLLGTGTIDLPAWSGDPTAYVAAWIAWGGINAELARRVYELLWQRLAPTT